MLCLASEKSEENVEKEKSENFLLCFSQRPNGPLGLRCFHFFFFFFLLLGLASVRHCGFAVDFVIDVSGCNYIENLLEIFFELNVDDS